MKGSRLDGVIRDKWMNAVFSWGLVLILVVSVIDSFLDDPVWGVFSLVVLGIVLFPALRNLDPYAMLPWEVLILVASPVLFGGLGESVPKFVTHLSVAALALVFAVEIHVFTKVRMTDSFAVIFVVMATAANAGFWALLQWFSDIYLTTTYLKSEELLMQGFVAATASGFIAGILFILYFRRFVDVRERYGGKDEAP